MHAISAREVLGDCAVGLSVALLARMIRGNVGECEVDEPVCWRWRDEDGGEIMRVLVGDTEDIKSSRDGSGGLGTDMLERLSSTSETCRHVISPSKDARLHRIHSPAQPWSVHSILSSFSLGS